MLNSIEDIIELHKNSGNIEDAIVKIHIDEKVLALNTFSLKVTAIDADKKDIEIWNDRIKQELKKDNQLEKEVSEFESVFELIDKARIKKGRIEKSECPDFVITQEEKTIGIEVTKIYVGYEWMVEKIQSEIKEFKLENEDIEGYIEYKKAGDKVEVYNKKGELLLSPKVLPQVAEEYQIKIKNKIYEKIRKLVDDYKKYNTNIIYANIVNSEYFEDIADLDGFTNEIMYYLRHLDANIDKSEYKLILKINLKWIEIDLNEGVYKRLV